MPSSPKKSLAVLQQDTFAAYQAGEWVLARAQCDILIAQADDVAVHWVLSGMIYRQQQDMPAAEQAYLRAIACDANCVDAWNNVANVYVATQQFEQAAQAYRRVIALHPQHIGGLMGLAEALRGLKNAAEAAEVYDAVLKIQPDNLLALLNLGRIDTALQRYEAAETVLSEGCRHAEGHALQPDFLLALAAQATARAKPDQAVHWLDALLAIAPDHLLGLSKKAELVKETDPELALLCFKQAVAAHPQQAALHNNLGAFLIQLRRVEEAIPYFERAVALGLDEGVVYANWSSALVFLGRLEAAVPILKTLLVHQPDNINARSNLVLIQQKMGDWSALSTIRPQLIEPAVAWGGVGDPPLGFPFLVLPVPISAAEQLAIARHFARYVSRQISGSPPATYRVREAGSPLRIGYVSADYHNHATAHLMRGLFKQHDRRHVTVYAYSFGPDDGSQYRQDIQHDVDHFIDLSPLSPRAAAAQITADGIDILIDLKGYTRDSRPEIFAQRPAPIQVAWLGYPGTMGADFIDYILTDRIVSPPDQQAHYSEKFAYLPHCYQINDDTQAISPEVPSRAECQLPEGHFVYCCFCALYKIEPVIFNVWLQLLKQTPHSVLWLLDGYPEAKANLRAHAQAAGINPARLIFAPNQAKAAHLARHQHADIFLDTYACNGHTTASDALWAGVPVITCPGDTFATRVGASLLTAIALPELIASDLAHYTALAQHYADHPAALAALKAKLSKHRRSTPLFDTAGFVRDLEAVLAGLWQAYAPLSEAAASDLLTQAAHRYHQGDFRTAQQWAEQVGRAQPQRWDVENFLGVLARQQGQFEAACAHYQRALEIAPDAWEVYSNLGNVLREMEDYPGAIAAYRTTLAAQPDDALTLNSLGGALLANQQADEAVAAHEAALVLSPDQVDIHWDYALALLGAGRWKAGFIAYEWRWRRGNPVPPVFSVPAWTGGSLVGQHLFVYVEQGFGDAIQFMRYLPVLLAQVDHLTLEVRAPLAPLVTPHPKLTVYTAGMPLPAFDCHVALLSLPYVLGLDDPTWPGAIPYLSVPAAYQAKWAPKLAALPGYKVGLIWAGNPNVKNDRIRSPNLPCLQGLWDTPGVTFVLLQQGAGRRDLDGITLPPNVVDWAPACADFADTAAIMQGLDCVISSDTGPAHVSAALGVPTWMLLHSAADWRWGQQGVRSPWYPTARLFRQPSPGDWAGVATAVQQALTEAIAPPELCHWDELTTAMRCFQLGEVEAAAEIVVRAQRSHPEWVSAWVLAGMIARQQGHTDDAISAYLEAARRAPTYLDPWQNLTNVCLERGDKLGAGFATLRCAQLGGAARPFWQEAAGRFHAANQPALACAALQLATAAVPEHAPFWLDLGATQAVLRNPRAAISAYETALALNPSSQLIPGRLAALHNDVGVLALAEGDLDAGISALQCAVQICPDDTMATFNLALGLLMQGNFAAGFQYYEARLKLPHIPARQDPVPRWQGEPIAGKRVLIYAEQGLGDTLQFLRWVPAFVSHTGAMVVLEVQPALKSLIGPQWPVVSKGDAYPTVDYMLSLLSLPYWLKVDSMAGCTPYMVVPTPVQTQWQAWLQARAPRGAVKVGLVWAGSPTNAIESQRSPGLQALAPLFDLPNTVFVCLQQGAGRAEIAGASLPPHWLDPDTAILDFADTAALMQAVDIVISTDTSTAHMAGALGVPTWVMLHAVPDWRWGKIGVACDAYPTARLFRQIKTGDWAPVIGAIREALHTYPRAKQEVWQVLEQGILAHQQGDLLHAQALQQQVWSVAPTLPEGWLLGGVLARARGELVAARHAYRQALQLNPNQADAWHNLANALRSDQFDLPGAAAAYRQALVNRQPWPNAWCALSDTLREMGDAVGAIEAARHAVDEAPTDAGVYNHLGNALHAARDARAAAAYQHALTLAPQALDVRYNYAVHLQESGEYHAAIPLLEFVAQRAAPEGVYGVKSRYNLALAYQKTLQLDAATTEYLSLLAVNPAHSGALMNLAALYNYRNRPAEALPLYRTALAVLRQTGANYLTVLQDIQHLEQKFCNWAQLPELRPELIAPVVAGEGDPPPSPFGFLVLPVPISAAEQLAIAQHFARYVSRQISGSPPATYRVREPGSPLRIGYVSADYHNHATAHLMRGLFKQHDRRHVTVYAYSFGPDDGSQYRQDIQHDVDHFIDLSPLSPRAAAAQITADGIDILIDLKGYTRDSRPEIFAQRPAPIQVAWLGYPGTMGADFIDYILTDRIVSPPDQQAHYSEKFAYLPHCYQINDDTQAISPEVPSRAECQLPEGHFVYCCFCALYKIEPVIFNVWLQLLKQTPHSVLWLLDGYPEAKANLRAHAQAAGIDPARLIFAPNQAKAAHLARHQHADIFLDTYACNGHTTASDALWAGVPVITCPGDTFATRVGASLLTAIALPELIASDLAHYTALAQHYADHPAALAALKAKLSKHRRSTPLFDTPGFVRDLEAVLAGLWQAYAPLSEAAASDLLTQAAHR